MGLASPDAVEHATDAQMQETTQAFDADETAADGYWQQNIVNDHVRTVTEKVKDKHYCTRSLIRSAMTFEAIQELNQDPWWKGRIYYRDLALGTIETIATSEDLGESGFRQKYRELGGTARW